MSRPTTKTFVILKAIVYLILVSTSLFIALPLGIWLFTRELLSFYFGVYRLLGFIPLALGVAFTIWTTVQFPIYSESTPAHSDQSKKLISTGLFKYTRNPMYLGAILTLFGQTILFESPVVLFLAILMWFLLHLLVVYREEPELRRRFGKIYEEYSQSVPRWLPRIFREDRQDNA